MSGETMEKWLADANRRIAELEAENERLRKKFMNAITRMDRARHILTDGKPTPGNNWGMLDISDLIDTAMEGK